MALCYLCNKQSAKSKYGSPHEYLRELGDARVFSGHHSVGFKEQDYQCLTCKSKFTFSTNKNDFAWVLWQEVGT